MQGPATPGAVVGNGSVPGSPVPSLPGMGQSSPVLSAGVPTGAQAPLIMLDGASAREDRGPQEPLRDEPPTPEEEAASSSLRAALQFTVESNQEGERRGTVLVRLEKLIKTWICILLRAKGYERPDEHGGRLLCFGSYALGVHFPGADIDTLCIAPREVDREDFFTTLVNILKKHKLVQELNPVRDAHVPVIKMKFDGIQIDLVFSALDLERIPPSPPFNIGADSLLRNLDDASQRSINGTRVAEKLLRCVPDTETFRWALRGIKLWAKNRGVYGNIYGFPGGVAWAIMTAAICQLLPRSPPSVVLRQFFKYYRTHVKEEGPNNPVYLTRSLEVSADIGKKSWDRSKIGQYELLPVITPMPPYMNSCYNVSRSNLRTLCQEFARGDDILEAQGDAGEHVDWSPLWAPNDFFLRYKLFVQVQVSALDNASFNSWAAFIESKIRHLVQFLDMWPQYSDMHEVAKTSDLLELRVWPFLFQSSDPSGRLLFSTEDAPMHMPVQESTPIPTTPPAEGPESAPGNSPLNLPSTPVQVPEESADEGAITGYFFVGVDTTEQAVAEGKQRQIVDFEGAIMQFHTQLLWAGKTDKMLHPNITMVRRRHVPEWVLSERESEFLRQNEADHAVRTDAKRKARDASGAGAKRRRQSQTTSSTAAPTATPSSTPATPAPAAMPSQTDSLPPASSQPVPA